MTYNKNLVAIKWRTTKYKISKWRTTIYTTTKVKKIKLQHKQGVAPQKNALFALTNRVTCYKINSCFGDVCELRKNAWLYHKSDHCKSDAFRQSSHFFSFVSSSSVLILHCSCVETLVGKKSLTANSCSNLYNRLYSGILELCSKPLGQPQVDKRG